ncbi:hypothetical protein BDW59DRAFT_161155 [Aspergillus cavernicola]|uniref:Uncharacterized protein n=1 Tax=Aspergillus cavernicola TaxID=176166 RepID=A0ABR4IF15_9EURO
MAFTMQMIETAARSLLQTLANSDLSTIRVALVGEPAVAHYTAGRGEIALHSLQILVEYGPTGLPDNVSGSIALNCKASLLRTAPNTFGQGDTWGDNMVVTALGLPVKFIEAGMDRFTTGMTLTPLSQMDVRPMGRLPYARPDEILFEKVWQCSFIPSELLRQTTEAAEDLIESARSVQSRLDHHHPLILSPVQRDAIDAGFLRLLVRTEVPENTWRALFGLFVVIRELY